MVAARMFKGEDAQDTAMSQVTRGIVRELHDEPHLEGRRLTVRFCKAQVEDRGLDPRTVADRHDINVADVYRALTYYTTIPTRCGPWNVSASLRSRNTTIGQRIQTTAATDGISNSRGPERRTSDA